MRSGANAGRRIVLPDIGEEEQQQQRPPLRGDIRTPRKEIVRIGGLGGKTDVDVPAGVPRIVRGRKPDGKRPEVHAGQPAPSSDELIERVVQDRRVGGLGEGVLSIEAQPDDRLRPGRGVIGIITGVPLEDGAAFARDAARKGFRNLHKPVSDKARDLCVAQDARRIASIRHRLAHRIGQPKCSARPCYQAEPRR
jgi:hypothetical protein